MLQRPSILTFLRFCVLACLLSSPSAAHGEGEFATTEDGVRVYYETIGTGAAIVMIAGGPGGSSARFRYTHTLLESCGQLVFVDNRGRGRSQDVGDRPNAYCLENDLKDVEAVRKFFPQQLGKQLQPFGLMKKPYPFYDGVKVEKK